MRLLGTHPGGELMGEEEEAEDGTTDAAMVTGLGLVATKKQQQQQFTLG